MPDPVTRATDPAHNAEISRELLAQMDEAATSWEHWKILLTSGMGFFTDAYDLFIIGVAATMIVADWHIASYQRSLQHRAEPAPTYGRSQVIKRAAGGVARPVIPWWRRAGTGAGGAGAGR